MEIIIETPEQFELYALLQMKSALKLEIAGLKHSRGSVYAMVKRKFGFKGNKKSVLEQLVKHINSNYQ